MTTPEFLAWGKQIRENEELLTKMLNMSVRKIQYKLKEYRKDSASTLRSEKVRTVSPPPSPVPKKKTVFVANPESREK